MTITWIIVGHADRIRDRIRDLSKEGLTPREILSQLAGEGYTTSLEYIYKVRSQHKKKGLVFPESREKPSSESARAYGKMGS